MVDTVPWENSVLKDHLPLPNVVLLLSCLTEVPNCRLNARLALKVNIVELLD